MLTPKKITAQILAVACAATLCIVFTIAARTRQVPIYQSQPVSPLAGRLGRGRPQSIVNGVQIQTPEFDDVIAMEDALPNKAPAAPKKPRKVLVLAKASGFVHSSIPLTAATVKALGDKTGAWSTTVTYDSADINEADLQQYDLLVLDNTTGAFLDDPSDDNATSARKSALLGFVRGGKGLVGIHAATDAYHTAVASFGGHGRSASAGGGAAAQPSVLPQGPPEPTWPDFNNMIGGIIKFHWTYPQAVTIKIDDPKSSITAMFHGQEFQIHDEIYTFSNDSFSRKDVHVLTSVDYSKMSDEDKAKETVSTRRTDGDYALSWIRRDGKGRVFYEALGHSEHVFAMPLILQHIQAGIQYALGDLSANDSPSYK